MMKLHEMFNADAFFKTMQTLDTDYTVSRSEKQPSNEARRDIVKSLAKLARQHTVHQFDIFKQKALQQIPHAETYTNLRSVFDTYRTI